MAYAVVVKHDNTIAILLGIAKSSCRFNKKHYSTLILLFYITYFFANIFKLVLKLFFCKFNINIFCLHDCLY